MPIRHDTSRRRFLASAAGTILATGLLPAGTGRAAGVKRVIHLFMEGGMSHIDTFDPKSGTRAIPTNVAGIFISEHLPRLAGMMDQIVLIRSMSHGEKSHGAARRGFLPGNHFTEEITITGWDTHTDNHARVAQQCAILDKTLSELLRDLESRGRLSETLVVVSTEFGRSAAINAFGGRNHHPGAFTCLLAGGGMRGGQVIGKTSEDGMEVIGKKISPADLNATIATFLGERHFTVAMQSAVQLGEVLG
jgi:Protein of unknown function (DUF1501)